MIVISRNYQILLFQTVATADYLDPQLATGKNVVLASFLPKVANEKK